jgi:hypothetical protein
MILARNSASQENAEKGKNGRVYIFLLISVNSNVTAK